jgi:hypothetical protein
MESDIPTLMNLELEMEKMMEPMDATSAVVDKLLSRIPEGWGKYISCNPGWWRILGELETKLNYLDLDYKINQVKEKFGTLRFYYQPTKDGVIQDIMKACVKEAEYLSSKTCEMCGRSSAGSIPNKVKYDQTVRLRDGGWLKTLCNTCAQNSGGRYPTDEEIEANEIKDKDL